MFGRKPPTLLMKRHVPFILLQGTPLVNIAKMQGIKEIELVEIIATTVVVVLPVETMLLRLQRL